MAVKSDHWVSDLWKNKWVKVPVIITLMALAVFAVLILGKAIFGYPVKLAGFEINQPETLKTETVFIHDTTVVAPKISEPTAPVKSTVKKVIPKEKQVSLPKKDTQAVAKIEGKNINTGTVIGNVGDNGVVNIGDPQRKLNDDRKNKILEIMHEQAKINNVDTIKCITIASVMGNKDALNLATQIRDFLKTEFDNVPDFIGQFMQSPIINGVKIGYKKNCMEIKVGY